MASKSPARHTLELASVRFPVFSVVTIPSSQTFEPFDSEPVLCQTKQRTAKDLFAGTIIAKAAIAAQYKFN